MEGYQQQDELGNWKTPKAYVRQLTRMQEHMDCVLMRLFMDDNGDMMTVMKTLQRGLWVYELRNGDI